MHCSCKVPFEIKIENHDRKYRTNWKAGPPSAEFMILQPPINANRNNLLKMTSVGRSSTKLSKFLIQGGDSSTLFFNLVFFLCWKLSTSIISNAASIDSALLSWPEYCSKRNCASPKFLPQRHHGLYQGVYKDPTLWFEDIFGHYLQKNENKIKLGQIF